jgi:hypothetical protein
MPSVLNIKTELRKHYNRFIKKNCGAPSYGIIDYDTGRFNSSKYKKKKIKKRVSVAKKRKPVKKMVKAKPKKTLKKRKLVVKRKKPVKKRVVAKKTVKRYKRK